MTKTTIGRGDILVDNIASLTITPVSVGAGLSPAQTFPLNGLQVGDHCDVRFQGLMITGIVIANAYCAAANVLTIQFLNPTAGAVVPSPGQYVLNVNRCEDGFAGIPTNML